jgi:hypothetical protein
MLMLGSAAAERDVGTNRTFAVGPRKITEKLGRVGLTIKIKLNYSSSPYRAVNTVYFSYTNQSVNVV